MKPQYTQKKFEMQHGSVNKTGKAQVLRAVLTEKCILTKRTALPDENAEILKFLGQKMAEIWPHLAGENSNNVVGSDSRQCERVFAEGMRTR
jgi:hypothetical protein